MGILQAGAYGAAGALAIQIVTFYGHIINWQSARHQAIALGKQPPSLHQYVDILADSLAMVTRVVLGAMTVVLLNEQITGAVAAMLLGAAAPAILTQLGRFYLVPSIRPNSEYETAPIPRATAPESATEVEAP
jgi:hypothetical protein